MAMFDPIPRTAQTTWVAFEEERVDDSGICSPPMWTRSPPQRHLKNNPRSLSPTSRTQAIVRGQRELMEMVKNMPESHYELSLKDLVEHHRQDNAVQDRRNLPIYKRDKSASATRKVHNKMPPQLKTNGSIPRGGFYLKMSLPFSLGFHHKKKPKNDSLGNSTSRVTPKPDGSTKASSASASASDKDWWKKSPSAFKDTDSRESSLNSLTSKSSATSSTNTSPTTSRRENGDRRCWPFIGRPKSRTLK